ncbi:caspase-1-like [Morone saxatilis]|uniref:caspase-1-like n=1 Tax=Morone saxatilis TaxID=34816 RepID=UPI0015E2238E|nr:caspase-1-like [Morone saxatilis]
MADELFRVRSKFVEKVSKDLIKQLLDNILDDCIVNDGERDSIIEENVNRADRARCLLDTVKRKGDVASRKFIAHIQRRDPTLYDELGLAEQGLAEQPAPPAAETQMDQEWSTTLIPTTEKFWMEKQNDKKVYPVSKTAFKNRVALLITNITFTNEKYNRKGAEKDQENMEKLLKALGYDVLKRTNLTAKEIDTTMIEFSKNPKLRDTDSVVVVIMSHGKLGTILGKDWKDDNPDEFSINNIYEHLGSEKCPALLNKPKIIIIQACRGEAGGAVLVSVKQAVLCDDVNQLELSAGEENIEDDTLHCVHREKDFISLLSSTPDTVSYRHPDRGCFLIQYIVDVINTFAHVDDIEELFRTVMQRFEDFPVPNKRQMPTKDRCTLTKRFYFFPGL